MKNGRWLEIARELQSLGQTGLAFSEIDYDKQRYERIVDISAEIVSSYTTLEKENTKKVFMQQPGYATPKIDVRAAVIQDDKILLVREKSDGLWAMPGGWADVGDIPSMVAERETLEESGYIVKAKKLVGVFDANRSGRPMEFFHAFKIIFICELIGGTAQPSDETTEVGFFDFNQLPQLSSNRTNERHLNVIQEHLINNLMQTSFD
ncbi:MAG: NUDIX hydrolase [Bacteroidetes bacterium]|nr:NUDIX hydrolase [Bacteroidota bacterium]MBU1677474.1 NUDIX hydrolase [Bacteroidota bacterium]MBU2506604.1 NUDIX hydrolase [Bacteroidota bacterium]